VWGGNFFGLSGGYICWWKHGTAFSECELAYCSMINSVRLYDFTWNGMLQGNMKDKEIRIHPTQKPVRLYKWLLSQYAKPGMKILDTHFGSGSIAIACNEMNISLIASEIDTDYFNAACKRIEIAAAQGFFDFEEMGPGSFPPPPLILTHYFNFYIWRFVWIKKNKLKRQFRTLAG
jgi:site-specific DNA-methyltransferase (adenine-specific)